MGRPKKEIQSTSAERMRKFRAANAAKREQENKKHRETRMQKKKQELSEEEKCLIREQNRIRKQKSRENKKNELSRQKLQGLRLKEKNRKRKERDHDETSENSTPRVRKHRLKLKVNSDFNHSARNKSRKVSEASSKVSSTLSSFSPNSKSSVIERCVDLVSPASKSKVIQKISPAASSPLLDIYKSLSRNGDNTSNRARRLVLNKLAENKKVKQMHGGLSWLSLKKAGTDVNKILFQYKTERQKSKPKPEYVKKVSLFYNKDHISRTLPYKKLTKKIIDQKGNYERAAIRVMEIALRKAYQLFVQEHPEVKICRRQFETLRPKNIRLKSNAKCLVRCCVYHTNIEYL